MNRKHAKNTERRKSGGFAYSRATALLSASLQAEKEISLNSEPRETRFLLPVSAYAWSSRVSAAMTAAILLASALPAGGCFHPHSRALLDYMDHDPGYLALEPGPARVDAIFVEARRLTGSNRGALDLCGHLAVSFGIRFEHPFTTGLEGDGPLASTDRTGHFFSYAMWKYQEYETGFRFAGALAGTWEVLGGLKALYDPDGAGFDVVDIWANNIGREFARQLHAHRDTPNADIFPSRFIHKATLFRPDGMER